MKIEISNFGATLLSAAVAMCVSTTALHAAKPPTAGPDSLPGAIFTTNATGERVNQNIFASKETVYLDGGPKHTGAAGLPAGVYYVQVTNPSGSQVLGTSIGSGNDTPFVVGTNGEPAAVYELSAILIKGSDATPGYDTTSNEGGEYKVWVSTVADFSNSSAKTDNFKVKTDDGEHETNGEPETAKLNVVKYYDTNANGVQDDTVSEPNITGWLFHVSDDIHLNRNTPFTLILAPGQYTITEMSALETSWVHTTSDILEVGLAAGADVTEVFGNVCIGNRGGHTLGFWSNKNGQAATTAADTTYLASLNLRNPNGTAFDPTNKTQLPKWFLGASATNMACMLSAQMASMALNIRHPEVTAVDPSAIIYRPELNVYGITFNSGFITLGNLVAAANASLVDPNGNTVAAGAIRTYQEKLKNALDDANNDKPFYVVPPNVAVPFTF
jgi:hypothetical protein